jgi:hypothetical protein
MKTLTFTIYNKEAKTIAEDKEFNNGYEADKYTKETYGEGWSTVIAKSERRRQRKILKEPQ